MWGIVAGFIGTFLGKIVFRILALLGITLFTFVGIESLMGLASDAVNQFSNNVPAHILNLIALSDIDVYFTMVISAYIAVYTLKLVTKFIGFS